MSQFSPSQDRRLEYGDGAYGYENADGLSYYNDGNGYSRYLHPDIEQCWEQQPGLERIYGPSGDDEQEYDVDGGDDGGEICYDNDQMDIDPPPPYSEYEEWRSPHLLYIAANHAGEAATSPLHRYSQDGGPSHGSPSRLRQTARRGSARGGRFLSNGLRAASPHEKASSRDARTLPQNGRRIGSAAKGGLKSGSARGTAGRGRPGNEAARETSSKHVRNRSVSQADKPRATTPESKPKTPAKKKCSQCQVSGHDSRNCPLNKYGLGKKHDERKGEPVQPKMVEKPAKPAGGALLASKDAAVKKPVKKKCSQCSVAGHDARICPLNQYGLGKKSKLSVHEHHHETTTTTTTTTTKTSSSSKSVGGKVASGRIEKSAPKKKQATATAKKE